MTAVTTTIKKSTKKTEKESSTIIKQEKSDSSKLELQRKISRAMRIMTVSSARQHDMQLKMRVKLRMITRRFIKFRQTHIE